MMTIEELTKELDTKVNKAWDEYKAQHAQFDVYRGKPLEEKDIATINMIFEGIQYKFQELYPAFQYVGFRHQWVTEAVTQHDMFMTSMEKAGSKRVEEAQS